MDIVKNLVSRNAALSLANDIGDTAVDDAFSGGNLLIAAFLLVHGGKSAHARGWSYLVSSGSQLHFELGCDQVPGSLYPEFPGPAHSQCLPPVPMPENRARLAGGRRRSPYRVHVRARSFDDFAGFSTHLCDVDRQVGCYDWSCVSPGAWFIWVGVTHVRDVPDLPETTRRADHLLPKRTRRCRAIHSPDQR